MCLDAGFVSVRSVLPMRPAILSARGLHSHERLPWPVSGCRCTPCQDHAVCGCPRCHRYPKPSLTLDFMLALRVAVHEIYSTCMQDNHMLPTLTYIVDALTAGLASPPPECVHRPQRDRQATEVVQGVQGLPHS
jgi:hypothetical protein